MVTYLREVWQCRLFWISLAWLDLRKRYRGSLLGFAWAFLQPAVMALILCLVFCGAFQVGFFVHFPYVLVGLSFWNCLSSSIHQGCGSVFWSQTYILQHRAPMAIYPLRVILSCTYHFLLVAGAVGLVTWTARGLFSLSALLTLVFILLLLFLFCWSVATIGGLITPYFPDLPYLADIALHVLFYITPIFYRPDLLYERGLGFLVRWNPLAALADCLRLPLLEARVPPWTTLGLVMGMAAITFALASWILKKLERSVIFQL